MSLIEVFYTIAAAQSTLFAIFLLFVRKGNRVANRFYSVLLFIETFTLTIVITLKNGWIFDNVNVLFLYYMTNFLVMPFIYFYTKAMVNPKSLWKPQNLLHFLPFVIYSLYLLPYINHSNAQLLGMLELTLGGGSVVEKTRIIILLLIALGYFFFSFRDYKIYHQRLKENYSNIEKIQKEWLLIWLISSFLLVVVDMVLNLIFLFNPDWPNYYFIAEINSIFHAVFHLILPYYMISRSVFSYDMMDPNQIKNILKYKTSPLSEREMEENWKKIENWLISAEAFKNPDLSLEEMSKDVGIPKHYISQTINMRLGKNFYELINSYRVQEVASQLESKLPDKNILTLAFDAGFNSKASFNRAFKKQTGLTPLEYQRSHSVN